MPRIHDVRNDSWIVLVVRVVVFVVACIVAVVMLQNAGRRLGDSTSAFARYRSPPAMPHVFVSGVVRRKTEANSSFGALCLVEHQRLRQCGKSRCWTKVESFPYSSARIEITTSTAPLPETMDLGWQYRFEPWSPPSEVIDHVGHAQEWRTYIQKANGDFADRGFTEGVDRIVESCLNDGDPIFVEACVSPKYPGYLEACPGQERYGLVPNGDAQAVLDDAADDVARSIGGAAAALLVAALAWLRPRRPIMTGLEDRAAPHRKSLGLGWALLGVPPVLVVATVMMHASHPPSSWSTGRGGFAFALSMLALWLFFALQRWMHRRRTLFSLAPVLATERSLLANASGTVELAVKARGADLRSFIGDEPIAFTEIVISETYGAGRNKSTIEVYRGRLRPHLQVVDESGEGRLDLTNAILDVEERKISLPTLSPRYLERGISLTPHPRHISYHVKEWVIKDGEPLYVFGEVSDIALQASEGGYRTVRGSPTLGGKDAAPVIVHSGDERGLIALLTREARFANSYAVVAACMCLGIAGALIVLARF